MLEVVIRKSVVFESSDVLKALSAFGYDIPLKTALLFTATGPDDSLEERLKVTVAWDEKKPFELLESSQE